MRVSELAKELGYRAVELVALARFKGLEIQDARANIDARKAAAVRTAVPPRSKLSGPLLDLYQRVRDEENARLAARAAEPKPERKKKEPAARETVPGAKRVPRKKEPAAEGVKKGEEKAPPPPKPAKKVRVVEEFRLGDLQKSGPPPPAAPKPAAKVEDILTPEERERLRREAAKPLIDVDRVIGAQKEVHVMRPIEIEVFERDTGLEEVKEKRHVRIAAKATPVAGPVPSPVRPLPPRPAAPAAPGGGPEERRGRLRVPPPAMRPTVPPPKPRPAVKPPSERKIEITVPISVKQFCEQTGIKVGLVLKKLIDQGIMATINHALDEDMVAVLADEFKRDVVIVKERTAEEDWKEEAETPDDPKDLVPRAPVVTFMGHVDHGKTTLLDRIRNTKVAAGEAGGITQHIGAYKVVTQGGRPVVFLDTPGHEAFTRMRSRGARVTDIAVIVVDAADGVMPQTEEAINHARAAGVKIMVALNKIDKPQANPNRVKGQLAALKLNPEDWGGDVVCVEVSGLTGQGVDQLLELLSLQADLLELKANPRRPASGVVLEARKTEERGVVVTLLVQNGTLRRGDVILAGRGYGRVRSMTDDRGRTLTEAGPSTPVEVTGLVEVPDAGDAFHAVRDLAQAKEIAEERQRRARQTQLLERQHVTLETLFQKIETGRTKEVRVVLKVDVKGSLEVLQEALPGLSTEEVKLRLLHASVGAVSEGDVLLADASDALIVGFNVEVEPRAQELAKERGVEIRTYTVIYQAIEEMKAALEGLLEPELVEQRTGRAAVKEIFRISRVGTIAGCLVTEGKIERSSQIRIVRDGKVVHTGKLESLKRFKEDVKEVTEGFECGIRVAGHDDVREGDILEAFTIQKVARRLEKR